MPGLRVGVALEQVLSDPYARLHLVGNRERVDGRLLPVDFDLDVLRLGAPLLSVLGREVYEYPVVESFHAVGDLLLLFASGRVPIVLLFSGRPGHSVVSAVGGHSEDPLEDELMPGLGERRFRYCFRDVVQEKLAVSFFVLFPLCRVLEYR